MKIYDDQDRLHLSIVQKIQPGQLAIISTGGMSTTIAECTGKAHNGIWIKDVDGHPFFINWAHVRGFKDKEQPKAEPMAKAVLFVTDPALLKAISADADNDEPDILEAALQGRETGTVTQPYLIIGDRIEIPGRNAIDTPTEFADGYEMEGRWNLALHEAGHCVAALLVGGCNGAGIEKLSGEWHGVAYDTIEEGRSRYGIALAGVAAECLGPWPGGLFFDSGDFKNARDELRAKGVPEIEIIGRIAGDLSTMAAEFAENWTKGIRALALALCRQSWVNEDQIRRELGVGQAMMTKATRNTTAHKWEDSFSVVAKSSEFNALAADLKMQDADSLNKAMDTPGLTALEVSKLEAMRNRTATKADQMRAGK